MDIIMSGHKSKSQKMDLNHVRIQVKIAKDRFDLCPDTSQNRKIWQLCLMDFVLYGKSIQCFKNKLYILILLTSTLIKDSSFIPDTTQSQCL